MNVLIKHKLKSSSFLMLIVALLLIFSPLMFAESSSHHEESIQIKSSVTQSHDCGQETCQELRERVESLEETVRSIISAFSDEKDPNFTKIGQKFRRSRAVQSSANQEKGNHSDEKSKIFKRNGDINIGSKTRIDTVAGEIKKKSGGTQIKINKKTNSDDQRNIKTGKEKSLETTMAKRNQSSSINPITKSPRKSRINSIHSSNRSFIFLLMNQKLL